MRISIRHFEYDSLYNLNIIAECNITSFSKTNHLNNRKKFTFFIYCLFDLKLTELSKLTLNDINHGIQSNKEYIKDSTFILDYLNLFLNSFMNMIEDNEYVLTQILDNKKIAPNNLKKDILEMYYIYNCYYNINFNNEQQNELVPNINLT